MRHVIYLILLALVIFLPTQSASAFISECHHRIGQGCNRGIEGIPCRKYSTGPRNGRCTSLALSDGSHTCRCLIVEEGATSPDTDLDYETPDPNPDLGDDVPEVLETPMW